MTGGNPRSPNLLAGDTGRPLASNSFISHRFCPGRVSKRGCQQCDFSPPTKLPPTCSTVQYAGPLLGRRAFGLPANPFEPIGSIEIRKPRSAELGLNAEFEAGFLHCPLPDRDQSLIDVIQADHPAEISVLGAAACRVRASLTLFGGAHYRPCQSGQTLPADLAFLLDTFGWLITYSTVCVTALWTFEPRGSAFDRKKSQKARESGKSFRNSRGDPCQQRKCGRAWPRFAR